MTTFAVYAADTGTLLHVNTCDDTIFPLLPDPIWPMRTMIIPSLPTDVFAWLGSHYVTGGHVADRQTMAPQVDVTTIAADGIATSTIAGLPIPCVIDIAGVITAGPLSTTDGELSISVDTPGDIIITASAPPAWLPWEITIHAV